jgi:hypothetical protein
VRRRILVPVIAVVIAVSGIAIAAAQTEPVPNAPLGTWCPPLPANAVAGQDHVCKVAADPFWTAPSATTTVPPTTTTVSPTTTVPPTTTTTTTAPPVDSPPANADNTGHRVQTLTAATGSVFGNGGTAANPLVISGRSFSAFVEVSASHVVIRDSEFRSGLGVASNDSVVIEHSTIRNGLYLASSWNTTVRNTEVYGGGDLLHVTSDRAGRMVRNATFDTVWAHSDSTSSQLPDHVDGIQIRGVEGLTIRGSFIDLKTFQDSDNGAFFTQTANGGHRDIRIDRTWFNGGGISFRYEGTTGGVFEITNCSVLKDWNWGVQYTPKQGSTPTLQSGNRWQDKDGTWKPLAFL